MKKAVPYIIILLLIAVNIYTVWFFRHKIEEQDAKLAEAAIKFPDGMYHLNKKIKNFELITKDCFIIFSRDNGFSVGVTYPGKDFFWSDDQECIHVIRDGVFCVDFDRDSVFDFFSEKGKYFIVIDRNRIEVNKPDFKTMQAVASNGQKYFWNGKFWIKK